MNIFDGLSPEQISQLLSMNQGNNDLDLTISGQSQPSNIWGDSFGRTDNMHEPPRIPQAPNFSQPGDVSGFANYGMEAPKLPNPMANIQGIMGMAGNSNQNRKENKFSQLPQGGLMAYLQSLGV